MPHQSSMCAPTHNSQTAETQSVSQKPENRMLIRINSLTHPSYIHTDPQMPIHAHTGTHVRTYTRKDARTHARTHATTHIHIHTTQKENGRARLGRFLSHNSSMYTPGDMSGQSQARSYCLSHIHTRALANAHITAKKWTNGTCNSFVP